MVVGAMCLAALANNSEFYRIRSPVDWAMILLGGMGLADLLASVTRRVRHQSPVRSTQQAGLAAPPTNHQQAEANTASASFSGRPHQDTLPFPHQALASGMGLVENDPVPPEISIVLLCLNEAPSIGGCIDRIIKVFGVAPAWLKFARPV